MPKKHPIKTDERGFASVVIALLLITVLALLTVGFAQLARREQQSALSKQLATQALDAAESGINDASSAILSTPATITDSTPNVNTNNCLGAPLTHGSLSSTYGVGYKCVLVNLKPPSLQWDNVGEESQRYITFSTDTAATSFTVNWGSADRHNNRQSDPSVGFTPHAAWAGGSFLPVLEISITPLNSLSRCSLINNTYTAYLYPGKTGAGSFAYSTVGPNCASAPASPTQGAVISGDCTTDPTYPCAATITGFTAYGTGPYLLRLVTHYDIANVNVEGKCTPVTIACHFVDGQAVIDSTGQAKTDSKRLEVHIPLKANVTLPSDTIEGQNVCKRFDTFPGANNTTPDTSVTGCSLN